MRFLMLAIAAIVLGACSSSESSASGEGCAPGSCGGPPPAHCANGATPIQTCARANGVCGWQIECPASDATSDTSSDTSTASDTSSDTKMVDAADAPACPALLPTRLSACESVGQLCIYGCGIVRRCTKAGWDDDFTVDGGPPCP